LCCPLTCSGSRRTSSTETRQQQRSQKLEEDRTAEDAVTARYHLETGETGEEVPMGQCARTSRAPMARCDRPARLQLDTRQGMLVREKGSSDPLSEREAR
jgi:hypothetical protein